MNKLNCTARGSRHHIPSRWPGEPPRPPAFGQGEGALCSGQGKVLTLRLGPCGALTAVEELRDVLRHDAAHLLQLARQRVQVAVVLRVAEPGLMMHKTCFAVCKCRL